jgi:hypothetical protein
VGFSAYPRLYFYSFYRSTVLQTLFFYLYATSKAERKSELNINSIYFQCLFKQTLYRLEAQSFVQQGSVLCHFFSFFTSSISQCSGSNMPQRTYSTRSFLPFLYHHIPTNISLSTERKYRVLQNAVSWILPIVNGPWLELFHSYIEFPIDFSMDDKLEG